MKLRTHRSTGMRRLAAFVLVAAAATPAVPPAATAAETAVSE